MNLTGATYNLGIGMAVLDDLSGVEFDDVMEHVFCDLDYQNVRQADRRADEGRDVIMEEVDTDSAAPSSSSASTRIPSGDRSSRSSVRR